MNRRFCSRAALFCGLVVWCSGNSATLSRRVESVRPSYIVSWAEMEIPCCSDQTERETKGQVEGCLIPHKTNAGGWATWKSLRVCTPMILFNGQTGVVVFFGVPFVLGWENLRRGERKLACGKLSTCPWVVLSIPALRPLGSSNDFSPAPRIGRNQNLTARIAPRSKPYHENEVAALWRCVGLRRLRQSRFSYSVYASSSARRCARKCSRHVPWAGLVQDEAPQLFVNCTTEGAYEQGRRKLSLFLAHMVPSRAKKPLAPIAVAQRDVAGRSCKVSFDLAVLRPAPVCRE